MSSIHQERETLQRLTTRMVNGDLSRRGFLVGAMGLSSAALLSACAGGTTAPTGGSSGSGVIPLYTTENDPKTLAFFNMVIANFKKEHPDAEVKVTVYSDADQLQYLTTAFRNGVDVGVFSPAMASFPDFARAGHLLALDSLIQDIGEDEFMPGTRLRVDGHDVAMPSQSSAHMMYYRKDLLEGAGLAVPKTYDELVGALETLHGKDGISGIALGVGPTPALSAAFFAPYLYQSGQDYFDRDGNLTFSDPAVLEAVKRFTGVMKFAPQSMYNAAFGDIVSAYTAGQAAFAGFPGRLGTVLAERDPDLAGRTGVMAVPGGDFMTGQFHFGSTQSYAVHAKTANPELAKEFLKAMFAGPDAVAYAKTVPGHLIPPLKSVREAFVAEVEAPKDEFFKDHGDWLKTFVEGSVNAQDPAVNMGSIVDGSYDHRITNLNPFASDIWPSPALDTQMFQSILLEDADPEEAWKTCTDAMQKVVDTFRAENPDWKPEII